MSSQFERRASSETVHGFDARDVLLGKFDDAIVRQAVRE